MNINVFFFMLLFVGGHCLGESLLAQTLLPEDVVAAYKMNASSFYSSRVCYEFAMEGINNNTRTKSEEFVYDYWTDFNSILLRGDKSQFFVGGGSAKTIDAASLFSDQTPNNIQAKDFETFYRQIPVFSYFAKDQTTYKWIGYPTLTGQNNSQNNHDIHPEIAYIGIDIVLLQEQRFPYPPFLPYPSEPSEKKFPTDAFFEYLEENIKDVSILGKTTIDGKEYLVIECRKIRVSTKGIYDHPFEGVFIFCYFFFFLIFDK
ncbi:MAG: hypothetical protein LBE18_09000 [Planctomycetaceae bacterium]|jgi:hypothetical protein|nr:hypothetical protein [Planctomycetaceae bacterium]